MARPERFERPTPWFAGDSSRLLSPKNQWLAALAFLIRDTISVHALCLDQGIHPSLLHVRQCRTNWRLVMTTLTIRLDPKLEKALSRIAKSTGRTKSEIAREALERQVAVARFRELRRKTLPFAEAQGLVTDEDVFSAVS
jgi:predicted transcriptional regulator